jgi:PAS domain S-box-containing protein
MRNATHLVLGEDHFTTLARTVAASYTGQLIDLKEHPASEEVPDIREAESILQELAGVFTDPKAEDLLERLLEHPLAPDEQHSPNLEAKYRALLEQIPAVVFMAYLDRGMGEAYVSPEIEAALGYTREEWLDDPVLWYGRLHPDDKGRWSLEAAEMFLSGKPLRSAYRILARDGRVIWFQCDARMMRRADGRPWFIHGVAFDISDLKRTEKQLQQERNLASAILETVDALVMVLDRQGHIIRFNRACEQTTGYSFADVRNKPIWDLLRSPEEIQRFKVAFRAVEAGNTRENHFESYWTGRDGVARLIAWSTTVLPAGTDTPAYMVVSGMDITERKHLERTILDIGAREQRRIGQDLHDGLGQHLTGIAFMAKVQEQKLAERQLPEAADAGKIVRLVNDAISRTRELAKGLAPVVVEAHGLMSALQLHAADVEKLFGISCCFQCDPPVAISDPRVATHLYYIAQEAVTNALKHGRAQNILIRLSRLDGRGTLVIRDDGKGLIAPAENHGGMGLQIMRYRAGMIGGTFEISSEKTQGATVTCKFPLNDGK